jgi:RNA ligase
MKENYTPIFEFYSPESKIVLEYEKPFLTVIAIRHIFTGEYILYPDMKKSSEKFGIECVKAEEISAKNTEELVSIIKKKKGIEGYVLRFENGEMFKIKCDWYIDLHRCKSHLKWNSLSESHVWDLIFENRIDDTIATLDTEEEKKKLQSFNDIVLTSIEKKSEELKKFVDEKKQIYKEKKDFVMSCKGIDNYTQRLYFNIYDGNDAEECLTSMIKVLIKKNQNLKIVREILGNKDLIWLPFVEKKKQIFED